MIKTFIRNSNDVPTEEDIKMIREAKKRPIVFDEDCPESTPEQLKAFECVARQRNRLLNLIKA